MSKIINIKNILPRSLLKLYRESKKAIFTVSNTKITYSSNSNLFWPFLCKSTPDFNYLNSIFPQLFAEAYHAYKNNESIYMDSPILQKLTIQAQGVI